MWFQWSVLGLISAITLPLSNFQESTPKQDSEYTTAGADVASDVPLKNAQVNMTGTMLASKTPRKDLDATIRSMQSQYENTKSFSTSFTQRYTYTMLRKTQVSQGQATYMKPGRIKWSYTSPARKSFIVNDGKLWVDQPEENLVMVDNCFKEDSLTASLSFLWGSANLKEQFRIEWFNGTFGDSTDLHLLLFPLQPQNMFSKLILVLDPKTYRVKQSIVVDPQGNVNQFIYQNTEYNLELSGRDFDFTPPSTSVVSRMPGSCVKK